MDIQRLRNLTTGRLHTVIGDVYEDIEFITGEKGILTHQLPNANHAIEPWLREKVKDPRFWDGAYDAQHTGEIELAPMSESDRKEFWVRYSELPDPIFGKTGE